VPTGEISSGGFIYGLHIGALMDSQQPLCRQRLSLEAVVSGDWRAWISRIAREDLPTRPVRDSGVGVRASFRPGHWLGSRAGRMMGRLVRTGPSTRSSERLGKPLAESRIRTSARLVQVATVGKVESRRSPEWRSIDRTSGLLFDFCAQDSEA